MAAFVTVKIEGGEKLRAALAKLNPAQNLRIFKEAASEIAQEIATDARENQLLKGGGPISLPSQTLGSKKLFNRSHRLYDSIGVDYSPLPKAIEVGTDTVVYAARHEFGLAGMPARPFMAPALEKVRPRIPEIVIKHWKVEAGI